VIKAIAVSTSTLVALLMLSAFTPTVVFPEPTLEDARQVFLIDHGTHSSLALETHDGQLVRFAYGDMRYYAKRDTTIGSGVSALLIPTPATLGKGDLSGPANLANLERQLLVVSEAVYAFDADAENVEALISVLNGIHAANPDDHIDVAAYGLTFAPHPDDYFWANNSSSAIAKWIRALGVRTFGWGLTASWRVSGG
jgi:hypothetical protein